jgi:glutathione peroxidase
MDVMDKPPVALLSLEDAQTLVEDIKSSGLIARRGASLLWSSNENCFLGTDLVQFLLNGVKDKSKSYAAKDVENAVAIAQSLLDHRLAHHISDEHVFKNEPLLYRFFIHESAHIQKEASLLDERVANATLAGYLKFRSTHIFSGPKFADCYVILKLNPKDAGPSSPTTTPGVLYVYSLRSAPTPFLTLQVQDCTCDMTECVDCLAGAYCFTLSTNKLDSKSKAEFTFCAKNSKQMEAWMFTLQSGGVQFKKVEEGVVKATSLFELSANDLMTNEVIPLSNFKGKVCLVTNVSSKCGLAPKDYPVFVELHKKYASRGLVILAFPSNQFNQELATPEEIRKFVDGYGVEFPMFAKIMVNGEGAHPVFKFLKQNFGGVLGSSIKWNFTKFLCDREGKPVKRYSPLTSPTSFEADIVELLGPE